MISLISTGIVVKKVTVMKKKIITRKSVSKINRNQKRNPIKMFKISHFGKTLKEKEPQDTWTYLAP